MALLIGIAGGTGSGKTVLSQEIVGRFGGVSIDMDSYYLDRSEVPREQRDNLNYDEPAAIDLDLLLDHLRQLAKGQTIEKPIYSFQSHTRIGAQFVPPAELIVIDGLYTLWWDRLRSFLNLKIFVHAPPDLRLARRIHRDVMERGRTVDGAIAQYLTTAGPMHERYVGPTRAYADLVVINDGPIQRAIAHTVSAVQDLTHPIRRDPSPRYQHTASSD